MIKVKVYWNLRRKCWSIQQKGKVIGYSDSILMENVTFKVSEKRRQRVLQEKRKNVHAFAEGFILEMNNPMPQTLTKPISYNPYRFGHFFDKNNLSKVESNSLIYLGNKIITGME